MDLTHVFYLHLFELLGATSFAGNASVICSLIDDGKLLLPLPLLPLFSRYLILTHNELMVIQDKFTEVQVNKLRSGGNAKCLKFFEASPEYSKDMLILDKVRIFCALMFM